LRFETLELRQLLSINTPQKPLLDLPEANHAAAATIEPVLNSDLADLVDYDALFATNFGFVSTTTPTPGASFTVETYPYNAGTALSGGYTVRYRISTDTTYSLDDTFFGDVVLGPLDPGLNDVSGMTANFPLLGNGTYYVVSAIDELDEVVESDEFNNTAFINSPLTISGVILPDRFEPNDNFAGATNFGTIAHREEPDLSIHSAGNDDYYKFTAAASGTATVDLSFSHAEGDLDMFIFDSAEVSITNSSGTGDTEHVSFAVVAGQNYYVSVFGFSDAVNPDYDMVIDSPAPLPDRFEENDSFATAAFLGPIGRIDEAGLSIHSTSTDDYFRFTANNSGSARADLLFSHAGGDLDLYVYDASLALLDQDISVDDNEHVDFGVIAGQTYYIRVDGYNGAINANYELIIEGPAEIQGIKFNDLDGDGVRDAGEMGIAGWTMYLDANDSGAYDSGEPTAITGPTGQYSFGDLYAGDYSVGEIQQSGWTQTVPNATPRPDLVVTSLNVTPEPTTAGAGLTVSFSIKNLGTSGASSFDIGYYLSPDPTIVPFGQPGSDKILSFLVDPVALGAGGTYSTSTSVTLPPAGDIFWAGDGDYYLGVYVDDISETTELNEQNNGSRGLGIDLDLLHITGTVALASASLSRDSNPDPLRILSSDVPFAQSAALAAGLTTTASDAPVYLDGEVIATSEGEVEIDDAQSNPLIDLTTFQADSRFAGIDGHGFASVIIDTGIDLNHSYFGPDADFNGVADRIVFSYDFSGANDPDASDANGHGSNVASIVGSQNATHPGMAPATNIIALKVFTDGGSGSFSDIEQALQWVVANAATFNIASVNMSLGDQQNYSTAQALYGLSDEIAALAAMNVIVVSSAGNKFFDFSSVQGVGYPGADPNSLAVGAVWDGNNGGPYNWSGGAIDTTTGTDRIVSFSQRHATLSEIFAPGALITGANQSGGTNSLAGTSQAAPHIAGIATLAQQLAMQALGRRLTLAEFTSLLQTTGIVINDGDNENDNVANTGLNFRRVNVLALGEAILAMAPPPITGNRTVVLSAGETAVGNDFGNHATAASIVGRHLFYNQSGTASPLRYDGNDPAIDANDDLAIATNKIALLPGQTATFANVSSYSKGINGVMIDLAGPHGAISASDFVFRVGNNNSPNSWSVAPAPNSISVRAGAGVSGSDRIELTWANGAITKQWLEVIVLANGNTNLPQLAGFPAGQADVFFFGNAVADSGAGDTATQATVSITDELGASNNPASLFNNIPVTNVFDYNRDARVDQTDAIIARNNPTSIANVLRFLTLSSPPSGPEAPPATVDVGVVVPGAWLVRRWPTGVEAVAALWFNEYLPSRCPPVESSSASASATGAAQARAVDRLLDSLAIEPTDLDALWDELGLA